MIPARIPENEKERLQDLYSYNILDSAYEADYNELIELVCEICNCPMASITFIDKDRQWFKAEKNMGSRESSRSESFCGHTIFEKEVMVINDAKQDERFFDNPNVTAGIKIGFYAGAPIVTKAGHTLGAVCVIDQTPRQLTSFQIKALESAARQVSRLLELRLKNKQILATSAQLLEAEKKVAQLNLHKWEEENYKTAYSLHEEVAQTTAGVRLFIGLAQSNNDLRDFYLDHAMRELDNLTQFIRGLSQSITPTTLLEDNYIPHIENLLLEFSGEQRIDAHLYVKGTGTELTGREGLVLFRLIQELLQLAAYLATKKIEMELEIANDVLLNCSLQNIEQKNGPEKNLFISNMTNRLEMNGGSFTSQENVTGLTISMHIPLTEQ